MGQERTYIELPLLQADAQHLLPELPPPHGARDEPDGVPRGVVMESDLPGLLGLLLRAIPQRRRGRLHICAVLHPSGPIFVDAFFWDVRVDWSGGDKKKRDEHIYYRRNAAVFRRAVQGTSMRTRRAS